MIFHYQTLTFPKPLPIRFNKIDGFIRIYDGTRYLTLFGSENYDTIYYRIRYLIYKISYRYFILQVNVDNIVISKVIETKNIKLLGLRLKI